MQSLFKFGIKCIAVAGIGLGYLYRDAYHADRLSELKEKLSNNIRKVETKYTTLERSHNELKYMYELRQRWLIKSFEHFNIDIAPYLLAHEHIGGKVELVVKDKLLAEAFIERLIDYDNTVLKPRGLRFATKDDIQELEKLFCSGSFYHRRPGLVFSDDAWISIDEDEFKRSNFTQEANKILENIVFVKHLDKNHESMHVVADKKFKYKIGMNSSPEFAVSGYSSGSGLHITSFDENYYHYFKGSIGIVKVRSSGNFDMVISDNELRVKQLDVIGFIDIYV